MSFFYMTFNRLKYRRTADVDSLILHGIPDLSVQTLSTIDSNDFENTSWKSWTYIELSDYSGDSQTMQNGDKLNAMKFFSMVYHHNAYLHYDAWEKRNNRPLIYLNISFSKHQMILFLYL